MKKASQVLNNMGWRYVAYRGFHEFKKRSGLLEKKFPVNPPVNVPLTLAEWRIKKQPFFSPPAENILIDKSKVAADAQQIKNGHILFFSSEWVSLGKNYDWMTNPQTGFRYDAQQHWTKINDYSKAAGDIKYVWEKSRFSYLHTLIRDNHWNGTDHGAFVFDEIENWIDHNPVNCGPNYKCSQEISLRVLNWTWALYYYHDHPALITERWNKIINAIGWQMHHTYANINFSRIAVRNNHAITETLALYIIGTVFPWFSDSEKWKTKGRKWFESEVAYQVYEDGTFLQFSMNYHRVVVQLLTLATGIAELYGDRFDKVVYDRAYRSLDFLYQCQQDKNGMLPNYGANDGALFFPLSTAGYRDYRPQLNALHLRLSGKPLYEGGGEWAEEAAWFSSPAVNAAQYPPLVKRYGCIEFRIGGYYLVREKSSFTFIRCGDHKDRPSQADNLHIDIWVDGENVLGDAGSYKYNADDATLQYFMGTASHNTVMLDTHDQMLKGARFIWYYWTQVAGTPAFSESDNAYEFKGSIRAFRHLDDSIIHTRVVRKTKNANEWLVTDSLSHKDRHRNMVQAWHITPGQDHVVQLSAESEGSPLPVEKIPGWYSGAYGIKEKATAFCFKTGSPLLQTLLKID